METENLRQRNIKQNLDGNVNDNIAVPTVKQTESTSNSCGGKHGLYNTFHFIGLLLLLLLLTYTIHVHVTFLPDSKPSNAPSNEFSGDRARVHMEAIAGLGPRPSGSYANDIEAVQYISNVLNAIKEDADSHYNIEVEVQTVSGSFAFVRKSKYIDLGFTSAYNNITNVIAKISPKRATTSYLLVNAHYDTVMNTEGASDDTVSCAVLIESFRALSKIFLNNNMIHGVIFLLNGSEEGGLSGSHGFIQHRWFPLVKAVVNVEAAGSGGREFVFQTGPDHPWIIDTYASSAKYPYASIVAQEIFQSGMIPSDTDFRVFVDYGKLVGIDLAFINNGYVYHTKYDDAKSIPSGSIQRAGDNIFSLIKGIISSEYLENPGKYKHGGTVFFDVLGIFVIHYPQRLHYLMNSITIFAVIIYIIRNLMRSNSRKGNVGIKTVVEPSVSVTSLLTSTIVILLSWFLALVFPVMVASILMKLKVLMTWYSYPKFALLLYGLPAFFGIVVGHYIGNKLIKKLSSISILSFVYGHLIIFSVLLLYVSYKGLLSSFIIWFWVTFPFVFSLIQEQLSSTGSKNTLYVLIILGYTPPSLLSMYYLDTLYVFFGALMGRTGPALPTEIVMAILSGVSIVIVMSYLMCIYHDAVDMKTFLVFVGMCSLVPFIYVLSGRLQPYSVRNTVTPKRLWLQHTLRTFHDNKGAITRQDSGIWIQPMDATSILPLESIEFFKKAELFQCDGSYCGLPYYYAMRKMIKEHWYLRGDNPDGSFEPLSSDIYRRVENEDGSVRFNFDLDGPSHIMLFLTLKTNVTLDWSLYKSEDGHIYNMNDYMGGYTYFVFYSRGYHSDTWKFWLEFRKSLSSSVVHGFAELGIARHYLQGKNARTKFLNSAIRSLPEWICDNSWTSNYDSFTLE